MNQGPWSTIPIIADLVQKNLPLLTKNNNLYNKLTPSYFRGISSLSVEQYVHFLRWVGLKLV